VRWGGREGEGREWVDVDVSCTAPETDVDEVVEAVGRGIG
jgi:hypothetical protein